jgi:hypothetical protein
MAQDNGSPQAFQSGSDPAQGSKQQDDQGRDAMSRVRTAAGEDAARVASSAKARIGAQADELKEEGVQGLRAFSQAVRRAGDELGRSQQPGPIVDLVREAANGLEGVSESLAGKSSTEMLDALRNFGRSNPLAFVAGSMLAGFAIGRIASVSAPDQASGQAAGSMEAATRGERSASGTTTASSTPPSAGAVGTF